MHDTGESGRSRPAFISANNSCLGGIKLSGRLRISAELRTGSPQARLAQQEPAAGFAVAVGKAADWQLSSGGWQLKTHLVKAL